MNNNNLKGWMPALVSFIFVLGVMAGYFLGSGNNQSFFSSGRNNTLQEILNLVQKKYVDTVKNDSLTQIAIDDVLEQLDPHSVYIAPKDIEAVNETLEAGFYGLGIGIERIDDTIHVFKVVPNSPAQNAGLSIGDKLIKLNDSIALTNKKYTVQEVRDLMRGEENTTVNLLIARDKAIKKITLKRGLVPSPSVEAGYLIAPQTGFIRIDRFAERTYEEFMQQLEKLQKQNITKLILDLRDNGGGFMSAATAIVDEFLDGDKLIVYTQGLHSNKEEHKCQKEGLFEKGKLVVLINESSASASEVLAGALQDWDRATIVGRRSFGKGLVQQQFNLSNGGALRLTVSRYYTPLGRNIQKPYEKGDKQTYQQDLNDRFKNGELFTADTSHHTGKKFITAQGNVVYGGGGITPTYFVAADTSSSNLSKLYNSNALNAFACKYYINNKNIFSQWNQVATLQKLNFTDKDYANIITIAQKDSVKINAFTTAEKIKITEYLKAYMAMQHIDTNAFFEMQNKTDKEVQQALSILK